MMQIRLKVRSWIRSVGRILTRCSYEVLHTCLRRLLLSVRLVDIAHFLSTGMTADQKKAYDFTAKERDKCLGRTTSGCKP